MLQQRDSQKSKVYAWENAQVISKDTQYVPFDQCQAVVNHIWATMGWKYPPVVRPMPKQERKAAAKANRLSVFVPEDRGAKTTVLIHECAHSATGNVEGETERHGPEFVGVYMRMLEKLVPGTNLLILMHTANAAKVKFDLAHIPNILDQ